MNGRLIREAFEQVSKTRDLHLVRNHDLPRAG
jgi:hypothetical protein